ncbi:DEAD/DEAH box helicase [Ureaplasma urealyticum]|uniref:DEAD/DEAH box helicase n=1 Tax=Ureaplasma urealyticum TaxID=2130 RepID=UPI00296228D1|nr:AAA domain-containing protein [Ureaplasma urealyticum]
MHNEAEKYLKYKRHVQKLKNLWNKTIDNSLQQTNEILCKPISNTQNSKQNHRFHKLIEWFSKKKSKQTKELVDDDQYEIENLKKSISDYEQEAKANGVINLLDVYEECHDYEKLQNFSPWFSNDFRTKQTNLFILALKVRKQFLKEQVHNLKKAIKIWHDKNTYRQHKSAIQNAWHWINLAIPIISSTFASFNNMMNSMPKNSLGYVICDEAGQALPQVAVGAIFRSYKFIAVGDPKQIKPVLSYKIDTLLDVSVQTLVDKASKYGYYTQSNNDQDTTNWIGIPLWVHRRCTNPMFAIANAIAYDNKMVLPKNMQNLKGKTKWFNIKGKAIENYVKEQGEKLREELINKKKELSENHELKDKKIYVITPFKNVAKKLSALLKNDFDKINSNSHESISVGTVHTFQGKEAPIVYLVMGADEQTINAAEWAVTEPNIINVAATRAKKEFYIMDDKELYKNLGCMKKTIEIIDKYNQDSD